MEKETLWDEYIKKFDFLYQMAKEVGIDPSAIDNLIVDLFKAKLLSIRKNR